MYHSHQLGSDSGHDQRTEALKEPSLQAIQPLRSTQDKIILSSDTTSFNTEQNTFANVSKCSLQSVRLTLKLYQTLL